jgi:outer membrane lipopolysaccharide assembly protein LptE/RlpB
MKKTRFIPSYNLIAALLIAIIGISCSVSYKFSGTSIDYSRTKTIHIRDFTNQAQMVYAPLTEVFNETLKDLYARQTRLSLVNRNGDLEIDGEITNYDISSMSIQRDAIAAETRLTMRIKVRFTNNKNHDEDFERTYTSFRNFSSNLMLNDVQDELINEMTKEIAELIFNDTVANW